MRALSRGGGSRCPLVCDQSVSPAGGDVYIRQYPRTGGTLGNHIYTYAHTLTHTHTHTHTYIYMYVFVCTRICIYVCT